MFSNYFSNIFLVLFVIYNWFINGSIGSEGYGHSDCRRAYVYRDSYYSRCFKEDGFNECGFTNKFMVNDFDKGALNLGLYLPKNDYDDCCNIHNLEQIGEVSFHYYSSEKIYYIFYSLLNNDKYGILSVDHFVGEDDKKYPKDIDGHDTIDFEYYTVNEELSDLVDSLSFNDPFSCHYSLYLIASAVVCKKDPPKGKITAPPTPWTREPTSWTAKPTSWTAKPTSWTPSPTDKCNKYSPYYIKPCSSDPCPCDENELCSYNQCYSHGCAQCQSGSFQKSYGYPCLDCKEFFGEGCMVCNDWHGCSQCGEGYMQVHQHESDCDLAYCVQLPTQKPTPWTKNPTDYPTKWTEKPTPWTKEPTNPPTKWTPSPTPWTRKPTDEPTKYTSPPTPWTSSPTKWTTHPTSWTPSPIDPCQRDDRYYIEKCSKDPCPCKENPYCEISECKENGCNKCKSGYFQKGREYPCMDCEKLFGKGCMFCNDGHGCAQCYDGYTLVPKEDAKCGLSYCKENSKYY